LLGWRDILVNTQFVERFISSNASDRLQWDVLTVQVGGQRSPETMRPHTLKTQRFTNPSEFLVYRLSGDVPCCSAVDEPYRRRCLAVAVAHGDGDG